MFMLKATAELVTEPGPRIVIDGTTAEHARGGIGVVVAGLMSALAADPRPGVSFYLGPTTGAPDGVEVRRVALAGKSPGRMLFQRALLPATSASAKARQPG